MHEIYRGWREVADSYDPPRIFVAEAWVADNDRLARYLRPDELHTAFQFDFLRAPWRADVLRRVIDDSLADGGGRRRREHLGAVQPRRGPPRDPLCAVAA